LCCVVLYCIVCFASALCKNVRSVRSSLTCCCLMQRSTQITTLLNSDRYSPFCRTHAITREINDAEQWSVRSGHVFDALIHSLLFFTADSSFPTIQPDMAMDFEETRYVHPLLHHLHLHPSPVSNITPYSEKEANQMHPWGLALHLHPFPISDIIPYSEKEANQMHPWDLALHLHPFPISDIIPYSEIEANQMHPWGLALHPCAEMDWLVDDPNLCNSSH
jgi:hypothetical protein